MLSSVVSPAPSSPTVVSVAPSARAPVARTPRSHLTKGRSTCLVLLSRLLSYYVHTQLGVDFLFLCRESHRWGVFSREQPIEL